ncbi:MAG TPA: EAL domain-containing protein [Pseudonocardia sp.]|nr:EAL domain-containing protein [Pseudonocardia sp.]
MSIPVPEDHDLRLDQVVELVVELAAGGLEARLPPSPAADRIDAVIVGINMLAEELQALNADLEERVAERTRQLELAQQQLRRLALYDPLTGLANRTLLADRLGRAIRRAGRGTTPPAVLVLDLDGFKAVNDSFGHPVGDELLVEVATRLRTSVRDGDTVARLGGDEFALVVVDATVEQVLEVADRVLRALARPIRAGGQSCWVSASVGVRFATADADPATGDDADTLLRDADTAMYAAKARSRGSLQVYEPAMHAVALSRVRLADELRTAMTCGQLLVHYQRIVELSTGRTAAVEALVRWHHPVRGVLEPVEFLSVAEDTGLIVALDRWMLDVAVRQMAHWRRTVLGAADFAVHVNVSGVGFRSPGLTDHVVACLTRYRVPPADLLLEIAETRTIGEDPQTVLALAALRAAGVGVAIDDFGTGCSSLSYVRGLVVDVVKIDRTLITGLDADPRQHRIAASILGVVEAFGLVPVAEGVETAEQAAQLRGLGCRYGQGFLWGRPVPAAQLAALLRSGPGGPTPGPTTPLPIPPGR